MMGTPLAPGALKALRAALLAHYDGVRRELPWRGERDPYRILVSEVMLQQTRVNTVLGRYEAWLDRFPDLETLAAADEGEVLKEWEGLGYYRRARYLHRTARLARERPDGALPSSYAELRDLPGLGDYTAGAVASIAFGEVVPAADGNVRRVLARLFDEPRAGAKWLRATAAELVDPERPGDWNQALMELGATVCMPRAPLCDACPIATWCVARAAGTQRERPARLARRRPRRATLALAVLHDGGKVLLERRPDEGLLGGMWAFPEEEVSAERDAAEIALEMARARGCVPLGAPRALPACEHRFTHLHATYLPMAIDVASTPGVATATWVPVDAPALPALPVAQRRVLGSFARLAAEGAENRLGLRKPAPQLLDARVQPGA